MSSFYSQGGEDRLLAALFAGSGGVCVEVGAHNGVDLSNTYYFEQRGWKCILVEPNPDLCSMIRERRKGPLFECAASERDGEAVLHVAEGAGADLYSTMENDGMPIDRVKRSGGQIRNLVIPTRTLDSILEEARVERVDFVSIDVEGHELSVLRGFSLERWKPRVVLVEDASDLVDVSVRSFMRERGYVPFYRTDSNDWYAAPSESGIRNPLRLLASGRYTLAGIAKAWLPPGISRSLVAVKRKLIA
jgi:FkbM family methyltransferase